MNIDLSTQFRALRCIIGVKRVPILCSKCKKTVYLQGKIQDRSFSGSPPLVSLCGGVVGLMCLPSACRALRLFFLYRLVTLGRDKRRQAPPRVCVPGDSQNCSCSGGYSHTHTIYEFLHIHPGDTLESLREHHTYSTEETLLSLIMQGQVSPYFLASSL